VNKIKQFALACHNYENVYKRFPPAQINLVPQAEIDVDPEYIQWRARNPGNTIPTGYFGWNQHSFLLPYFEQAALQDQIDYDFDPATFPSVQRTWINMFLCPSDHRSKSPAGNFQVGKNTYRANAGRYTVTGENNDGPITIFPRIPFRDRKNNAAWGQKAADMIDGLSNTAMWSEKKLGDHNDNIIERDTDWYMAAADATFAAVRRDTNPTGLDTFRNVCLATAPQTGTAGGVGAPGQDSVSGQNWFNANYRISRYNHVLPPNSKSCWGNTNGSNGNAHGSTTASSFHPGGVNVGMCDGSIRFVRNSVALRVWEGAGGRKDGINVSAGDL
jgi:prepilin-type processing-associated H-X9-DG protein